ncbi:hypothetical protein TNCV_3791221 [Trichonephila clavipes]|nr:hypothetical protein TNCV_3791221 [Trichonephila clavipes]
MSSKHTLSVSDEANDLAIRRRDDRCSTPHRGPMNNSRKVRTHHVVARHPMRDKVYCVQEVHEQMFRLGGQSHAKTPSVKFSSKLGTHFIDPLKG